MPDFSISFSIGARVFRVILVLAGGYLGKKFLLKFFQRSLANLNHGINQEVKKERVKTLSSVLSNLANFGISAAVILIVLSELGVDIAPLIAGLGILGLGVGFASQALVRDFISGFFILFENQYNIGDEIEIAGKKGRVEEISLRTTILKDGEGRTHIIPNSTITTVTKTTEKVTAARGEPRQGREETKETKET